METEPAQELTPLELNMQRIDRLQRSLREYTQVCMSIREELTEAWKVNSELSRLAPEVKPE